MLIQARCEKTESVETARTSVLSALNSLKRSENAMISVGQTNVLNLVILKNNLEVRNQNVHIYENQNILVV